MQVSLRFIFLILLYVAITCFLAYGFSDEAIRGIGFMVFLIVVLSCSVAGTVYFRDSARAFSIGMLVPAAYCLLFAQLVIGLSMGVGGMSDDDYFSLTVLIIFSVILLCGLLSMLLRFLGGDQKRIKKKAAVEKPSFDAPTERSHPLD